MMEKIKQYWQKIWNNKDFQIVVMGSIEYGLAAMFTFGGNAAIEAAANYETSNTLVYLIFVLVGQLFMRWGKKMKQNYDIAKSESNG